MLVDRNSKKIISIGENNIIDKDLEQQNTLNVSAHSSESGGRAGSLKQPLHRRKLTNKTGRGHGKKKKMQLQLGFLLFQTFKAFGHENGLKYDAEMHMEKQHLVDMHLSPRHKGSAIQPKTFLAPAESRRQRRYSRRLSVVSGLDQNSNLNR